MEQINISEHNTPNIIKVILPLININSNFLQVSVENEDDGQLSPRSLEHMKNISGFSKIVDDNNSPKDGQ